MNDLTIRFAATAQSKQKLLEQEIRAYQDRISDARKVLAILIARHDERERLLDALKKERAA